LTLGRYHRELYCPTLQSQHRWVFGHAEWRLSDVPEQALKMRFDDAPLFTGVACLLLVSGGAGSFAFDCVVV
jgi:hypothetical protein